MKLGLVYCLSRAVSQQCLSLCQPPLVSAWTSEDSHSGSLLAHGYTYLSFMCHSSRISGEPDEEGRSPSGESKVIIFFPSLPHLGLEK